MDIKPRIKMPKAAKAGEIIEIKTLIAHPMENGRFKNPKTGEIKPRNIIRTFVARFDDREIFRMTLHPSISANPYIAFTMKAVQSGDLRMIWTDEHGQSWLASSRLEVTG